MILNSLDEFLPIFSRREYPPLAHRCRGRNRHRHSVGDRKQRLRRIGRPFLEELEIRTLLTATLSDIGVVGMVTGLNASVEVVGNTAPQGVVGYAFLLDSNGTFHNLGNLPGYSQTTATGISANGQVIGYSSAPGSGSGLPLFLAFLDVNGVMTPLGTLDSQGSEVESEPFGVNDSGQVVGWSNKNAVRTAFLYSDGQMTDIWGLFREIRTLLPRVSTIQGLSSESRTPMTPKQATHFSTKMAR
jgi:probable HAF family extracellular repeat protein